MDLLQKFSKFASSFFWEGRGRGAKEEMGGSRDAKKNNFSSNSFKNIREIIYGLHYSNKNDLLPELKNKRIKIIFCLAQKNKIYWKHQIFILGYLGVIEGVEGF